MPCDTGMVAVDSYYISFSLLLGLVLFSSYFVFFWFLDLFHYHVLQYVHKVLHDPSLKAFLYLSLISDIMLGISLCSIMHNCMHALPEMQTKSGNEHKKQS